MEQKIIVTIRLDSTPEEHESILHALLPLLGPTRALKGCLNANLLTDTENANLLTIVEEWKSLTDLNRHLGSDELGRILTIMEFSSQQPMINIHVIKKTFGLEMVYTVRKP